MRPVIHFDYPDHETINLILVNKHPSLGQEPNRKLIAEFWDLWRKSHDGTPPAPRDAIEVFKYALNLPLVDVTWAKRPMPLSIPDVEPRITRDHLGRAFSIFFEQNDEKEDP